MTASSGLDTLVDMNDSGGIPADLTPQQTEVVRNFLNDNLFAFAWYIFDYRDLIPSLHGRLAALLGKWGQPGFTRLMVQIPREFFKTSLCTRANSLWQVCRAPDEPVAIFNERLENSSKWLRAIKDVVQSSTLFHTLYKDLMPPGLAAQDNRSLPRYWKWSDTEINFQRSKSGIPEASITALGIGAATAGGHWPKIIKDDLISEDAARSSTVMEGAKEWFDKSLYLERPALKGMDLVVCTRWTYDDLYHYVADKYNYKVYRRSALEDGESIFPQKLTTEELLAQQRRDPYGFSSQMQNLPMAGREMNFQYEWLRWGSLTRNGLGFTIDPDSYEEGDAPRTIPLDQMNKVLLFDPAPSEERDRNKEKKARNGLVVEGKDAWDRKFILDTWAERVDPLDVIHQAFKMMDQWGTNTIAIEEVTFSLIYRHWMTELSRKHQRHVRFIKLKPEKRSKDTRITDKIPAFRTGEYYFDHDRTKPLVQEVVEFPYGATRDLLDALAYDACVKRPLTGEEVQRIITLGRRDVFPRNGSTRCEVTGY